MKQVEAVAVNTKKDLKSKAIYTARKVEAVAVNTKKDLKSKAIYTARIK